MDEEWIEGILKEDDEVILAFIQTYQDQVYSQSCRMLGSIHDAEEVCQDVFLKILKNIKGFHRKSKLSTWIYRITFTTCQDALKKRNRRPAVVDMDQVGPSWMTIHDTLHNLEMKEQRTVIDQAVDQLQQTDALLIELYHLQELSIADIAEITGMTKGSIKVRLLRARKKLAVHLEQFLPAETIKLYRNEK